MSDIQNLNDNYYSRQLAKRYHYTYTDGVKIVAELLRIVSEQKFQVWKLDNDIENHRATLTCDDGDGNVVYREVIELTDFPLKEIKLLFEDCVLQLPSER